MRLVESARAFTVCLLTEETVLDIVVSFCLRGIACPQIVGALELVSFSHRWGDVINGYTVDCPWELMLPLVRVILS